MRIIETTVYQFTELGDAAKEKAREWYRRGLDGDNYFAESVIEDAATIADLMGIDLRKRSVRLVGGGTRLEPAVYWSGFWSQGDGACFEGTWRASAVKPGAVAAYAPADSEIQRIAAEFEKLAKEFPEASFRVNNRGRYSHENCTEFNFNFPDANDGEDWPEGNREQWQGACDHLEETAKDFMRWIYRQLEREYEYQNADEQVDESIIANEYEFEEDGSRA
jgi:hypothetical protein